MGEWLTENALMFEKYAELSTKRQDVRRSWKEVEQAMNVVTECQLLWCSNHRFTLPIYSLLDNWYRRWYEPRELPNLRDLNYVSPKDFEFDFSSMGFAPEEFLIPVLWPVQVRINIPLIPIAPSDPLPDLPSLPVANIFNSLPVPNVTLPPKRIIPAPIAADDALLDAAKNKIIEMRNRIGGAQSMEIRRQPVGIFRSSMQDAYCKFPISIVLPASTDPDVQNTNKIVHIENDLNERLQRLFARWSPNQYEDFLAKQARIQAEFPAPKKPKCSDDGVCIDLPEEREERRSWQWFSPENPQDFTQLYEQMIPSFIENDDATENPFLQSITVLKRLFPNLYIPEDTNIILRSTTSP